MPIEVFEHDSLTFPHDWTEGTGTLGSSGQINIPNPAPLRRQWIFVQNQSSSNITVKYEARLANGTTTSWLSFLIGPGASAGTQGGSDERGFSAFVPQGQVQIVGAANAQVCLGEVVE